MSSRGVTLTFGRCHCGHLQGREHILKMAAVTAYETSVLHHETTRLEARENFIQLTFHRESLKSYPILIDFHLISIWIPNWSTSFCTCIERGDSRLTIIMISLSQTSLLPAIGWRSMHRIQTAELKYNNSLLLSMQFLQIRILKNSRKLPSISWQYFWKELSFEKF